jgi:cytochrome oxidase Cu insertion factor (SCO1/SenC/PrrC family)
VVCPVARANGRLRFVFIQTHQNPSLTETHNMNTVPTALPRAQVIRNRLMLIGIFVVFLAPVVLAYLGYFGGWFSGHSKANRGELLNPIQAAAQFQLQHDGKLFDENSNDHKWYLVLVRASVECDEACSMQLFTQQSTWLSLNKHQDRVRLAVVTPGQFILDEKVERWQAKFYAHSIQSNVAASQLNDQYFYLIDPMGNIVLRYRAPKNKTEAQERFKDIKADLDKLMKYSQIG